MHIVLFALAILVVALMPLAPHAVRFRIRVLRWIGWNWAANVLEENFEGWVAFGRAVIVVTAIVLFCAGWILRHE
jgi:hypothetical protein